MSFAPSELQQEIAALSSEIEAQKAILDDLIGRRSRAQRNLNAVLDPMARLPVELQSKIFVYCLRFDKDERASRPYPKLAPMLVSNVCQLWRDIAISTPGLWAPLRMEGSPRGDNSFQLYRVWLERSRPLPISLTLEVTSDLSEGVKHIIDWFACRVEEVSLLFLADPHNEYRIPQLRFQSLKKLVVTVHDKKLFYVQDWIDLMHMSPGLLHCTFLADFSGYGDSPAGDFEPCTLLALKELRLGVRSSSFRGINSTILLRYITLPALESLHIHCNKTLPDAVSDFSAFILRSSPPLRCLVLDAPTAEYLYVVPTLETLSLTLSTSDLVSVLETLATDPAFLPNLEHLTCTLKCTRSRGDFEVVVRMLKVRSLSTLRLNILIISAFDGLAAPDEDILVELRRIRSSGVDIYIGEGQQNLV
ncbi:hypothetical protein R3P38DRAFT_1118871 [Favolaschia claudopus]|uniref:F-box domain-containing protein n=1 Tax=Favolaschia claudopus TaxID=2862362 RepID=A0AAW0BBA4_9AGAR